MNKATVGHSAKYQYLAVLIGMLGARLFVKNRMIEKKAYQITYQHRVLTCSDFVRIVVFLAPFAFNFCCRDLI